MATRDRCDRALGTLDRLTTLPERPHFVVVDDGSSDETGARVREAFPAVVVVELSHSVGAAAARNIGVARASTRYVAFADDDSWWEPGALGLIGATFDRNPRIGLIAARVLAGDEGRIDPVSLAMARGAADPGLPGPRIFGFVACGAAVRRTAFLEAGGFPDRYLIGGEEEPLALSLAAGGWDCVYLEDAVARHMPSEGGRDHSRRHRRMVRNDLWTAWRHRRLWGALRRTLTILTRADTPAKRSGVLDAVRAMPAVLRERRPVPVWVERERQRLAD